MPNKRIERLSFYNTPADDNVVAASASGFSRSLPISALTNFIAGKTTGATVNHIIGIISGTTGSSITIPSNEIIYGSGTGITSDITFRKIGSNVILSGDSSRISVSGTTGAATIGVASNHSGYLHVTNSGGSNVFIVDSTTGHVTVGPVLTADTTFTVMGDMRFVTGNEGLNKVLVSDANGNADWQIISTGNSGIPTLQQVVTSGHTYTRTQSGVTVTADIFTFDYLTLTHTSGSSQSQILLGPQMNISSTGYLYFKGNTPVNNNHFALLSTQYITSNTLFDLPIVGGIIPVTVNGISANTSGNISVTGVSSTPIILTSGLTVTWDTMIGSNAKITLGSNSTLSIINTLSGSYGTLVVVQDSVGGRMITLPINSKVINGGGGVVTLSTGSNLTDILTFYFDGIIYWWNIGKNYN